jgi:predicted RNA binding protein YcfA (HicA-like mRNA interferase family)
LPRLKCTGNEVIDVLLSKGFQLHRHDGTSHRRYRGEVNGQVRFVDVAVHNLSEDIPVGTLESIVAKADWTKSCFANEPMP